MKLKNCDVTPIVIKLWTLIWFNDESRTCLGNWFQGGNVLIKIMQKSFTSYELEVLHYGLLVVEKTHLIF